MRYEQAYSFLIEKLAIGLPSYITYHDLDHTKNVIAAVDHLARGENITGDDYILLKTAALFHDAGFLQSHVEHEELSCAFARKHLPEFGYSHDQIERICVMITTTKLPQSASDRLSRVLCDADLYYLGADNYELYAEKLYREFKKLDIVKTPTEWKLKQAEFISHHKYFTETAIRDRDQGKQKNLARIQQSIEETLVHQKRNRLAGLLQDGLLVIAGVFFAALGLKGFLVPNLFFDGGVTGLSLLLHEIYHVDLALAIVGLNLPLIIVSYFFVGQKFALRMLAGVILLAVCQAVLPSDNPLTHDKLLVAIFGGAFIGIGIGLVMRAGAALDGTEVLALFTLKKTSFTITEVILAINIVIFSVAGLKFGIETALYSILTYFTATRCIDYVVEGIQAYMGVTIISGKSEAIKYQLVNKLGRGITVYKGERGFLPGKFDISSEVDIIFTVITRLELRRLKNLVYEADPNAFVFANTIREASGGVLKRRQHH